MSKLIIKPNIIINNPLVSRQLYIAINYKINVFIFDTKKINHIQKKTHFKSLINLDNY
jgi:hypothetical protein